jgi:hypothetical protein
MQTRRFAKRQMTYWRNEPLKRGWATLPREFRREEGTKFPGRRPSRSNERSEWEALGLTYAELVERVAERLNAPFVRNEVWYLDAAALL